VEDLHLRAAQFWNHQHHKSDDPGFWMAHPLCRRAINRRVSGNPDVYPFDALWLACGNRFFARALSLGCGTGRLERAAIRVEACGEIDAIDTSSVSLELARAEAQKEGLLGIQYRVGDLESLVLPRDHYDAVFFHHSLHHVRSVERLLVQVSRALKPDGLLLLDEWTGPARNEWDSRRLARANALYVDLPRGWRRTDSLPAPIERDDPTEAIRSSVIVARVKLIFDVQLERQYGGHIVSLLLPQVDRSVVPDEAFRALLSKWLALEDEDLRANPALSYHAAILAGRRKGLAGAAARMAAHLLAPGSS
jgi:SAM-dependent methyltransferase